VPALLRVRGFRFRFRASDGGEPPHVHVDGNGGSAKLWLVPKVRIERSRKYSREQIGEISRIAGENRQAWLESWSRFFGR